MAHAQVFSDGNTGSGVFWMFYQGADYEAVPVPDELKDALGEEDLEGMRLRPGLAMSQVRRAARWASSSPLST